ncbi:hypothetical protein BH10PSE12_BH10PSE12_10920 [soil metagenome]
MQLNNLIEKYGSDKKAVIEQTLKRPDVLDEYRKEMGKRPFLPLSHEDLDNVEGDKPTDWDGLLNAVTSLDTGAEYAGAYEKAIEALLTALLYPDLVHPVYQHEIHQGRKRIDIKYTNMAGVGFFEWLAKHYMAPQIFVECKNYRSEITNPELDQLSGRFGRSRGNVGMLICRRFDDKAKFEQRCRDTALDGRGYILSLDDEDLKALVNARKTDDEAAYREYPLLRLRFNALIS